MYLRKTVVFVALAALAAAPSTFAAQAPVEPGIGSTIVQQQPAVQPAKSTKQEGNRPPYCTHLVPYCFATPIVEHRPAVKPAKLNKPKVKVPDHCKQFGPYCLAGSR